MIAFIPFCENVYLTEYVSLRETKEDCCMLIQQSTDDAMCYEKLQQIRSIEKANGIVF